MKIWLTTLLTTLIFLTACNSISTEKKSAPSNAMTVEGKENTYPYVTAKINGKEWHSVKDEILATYSEFGDKLQIFTKDADGKITVTGEYAGQQVNLSDTRPDSAG